MVRGQYHEGRAQHRAQQSNRETLGFMRDAAAQGELRWTRFWGGLLHVSRRTARKYEAIARKNAPPWRQ